MSADELTRFDQSFATHMIRSFFLVLLAVIAVEVGIRFVLVLYDFHVEEKEATQISAERLAASVKSIMLNRGGPVAARTVYPILEKDHEEIGLQIAIQPSAVTTESIENLFGFTPRGIPPQWPEGEFQESRIEITAEEFCIQCHVTGKPGDVLGHVIVRSYLDEQLHHWWEEAQFTTALGMGKIVLHTAVLFILLQVRMAPLMSLKATIAVLAKAGATLAHRAPVKSRDEFGELARDLNLFLDRVSHIIEDLGQVLTSIVAVNTRLSTVHRQMAEHHDRVEVRVRGMTRQAVAGIRGDSRLISEEWINSTQLALSALATLDDPEILHPDDVERIKHLIHQLDSLTERAPELLRQHEATTDDLVELSGELGDFGHWLQEMTGLEEKMQGISTQGQTLLLRLTGEQKDTAATAS